MRKTVIFLLFLILPFWSVSCIQTAQAPLADAAISIPTAVPTTVPLLPTNTLPPFIPTHTPLPTANSAPSRTGRLTLPTPYPPIIIAISPEWQEPVQKAVTQITTENQPWQILVSEEPATELTQGRAQLALSEGDGGTLVYQEPIVLAVPFTTEWESASLIDAQSIIANGHNLVRVLPWSQLPEGYKSLRIEGLKPDDARYPLQRRLTLTASAGLETAVTQLAPRLQAELQPEPTIHLTAVGDIMLVRGLGFIISQGNLAYPFANVSHLLQAADIAVGNVESALGDVGEPAPKSFPFRAPPVAAESLALAGFDIVTLANNHGMDYGPEALIQALQLLNGHQVKSIGAGANRTEAHTPVITTINGVSLAFLGYVNVPVEASSAYDVSAWDATETTPGLAWGEPEIVAADVTAVRDQVDLVVVVLHSGFEYIEEPGEAQMAISKAAIDAGADLVIGHHAHILQGVEYYSGGVIVYGLGNFAFEIDGDPNTAVLNVWLDKNGPREVELIPAIIQKGGQPRLAEEWEAKPILQRVYFLTRILNAQ